MEAALVGKPTPLVALVNDVSEWGLVALEKAVGGEVRFMSLSAEHRFPRKKEGFFGKKTADGRPLDTYQVRGILKRRWIERHYNELPSVVVSVWCGRRLSELEDGFFERAERIKSDLVGRDVGVLCLAVVEEEGDEKKGVTVLRRGGDASAFGKTVFELAKSHYCSRARRVKRWEKHLKSPGLLARYAFQQGWYYEFADEREKAIKAYRACYSIVDSSALIDASAVADVAHVKLCRLALDDGRPEAAASQLKEHLSKRRRSPKTQPEEEEEDWAWLCRQHLVFARALLADHASPNARKRRSSSSKLVVAISPAYCEPAYHYACAAAYASRHYHSKGDSLPPPPPENREFVGPVCEAAIPLSMVSELAQEAARLEKSKRRSKARVLAGRAQALLLMDDDQTSEQDWEKIYADLNALLPSWIPQSIVKIRSQIAARAGIADVDPPSLRRVPLDLAAPPTPANERADVVAAVARAKRAVVAYVGTPTWLDEDLPPQLRFVMTSIPPDQKKPEHLKAKDGYKLAEIDCGWLAKKGRQVGLVPGKTGDLSVYAGERLVAKLDCQAPVVASKSNRAVAKIKCTVNSVDLDQGEELTFKRGNRLTYEIDGWITTTGSLDEERATANDGAAADDAAVSPPPDVWSSAPPLANFGPVPIKTLVTNRATNEKASVRLGGRTLDLEASETMSIQTYQLEELKPGNYMVPNLNSTFAATQQAPKRTTTTNTTTKWPNRRKKTGQLARTDMQSTVHFLLLPPTTTTTNPS